MNQTTLLINIFDDNLYEGDEVFNLFIKSSSLHDSVIPGDHNEAMVTIIDDDARK